MISAADDSADAVVIGAAGDVLRSRDGRVTLTIPPGAVSGPTRFAYSYPFSLPPGRGGLAPALGLSYSSARHVPEIGHFSLVGFGWEFVGADAIYIPPGDANVFSLTLQGTTYSLRKTDDGTWFAKENPFLKIIAADVSHYTAGTWYVWTPDGRKYTFGTDANPRAHYWKLCGTGDQGPRYVRLPLTRIDDAVGNSVTYTWTGDSQRSSVYECRIDQTAAYYTRFLRLTTISYNGGTTRAVVDYSYRADRPDSYDGVDWTFYTDREIYWVEPQADNGSAWQTVRRYQLQLINPLGGTMSQKALDLYWVQEQFGSVVVTLPKTWFYYSENSFSTQDHYGTLLTVTNGYNGAVYFTTEHRNGDTTAHVVQTRKETAGLAGTPDAVWSYAYGAWDADQNDPSLAQGYRNVTVTLPITGVETYAFHTLAQTGGGQNIDHLAGRAYDTATWAGERALVRNVTTWLSTTADLPISGYSSMAETAKPRFVYAAQSESYQDGQLVRWSEQAYDKARQGNVYQYGNLTERREYDCVTAACPHAADRTSVTDYVPNNTAGGGGSGAYIVDRPARQTLYGGTAITGTLAGETRLFYDQSADWTWTLSPTQGLLNRTEISATEATAVATTYEYYGNGNLYRTIDQGGHDRRLYYDTRYQAFPVCVNEIISHSLLYSTTTRYYGVPGSTHPDCASTAGASFAYGNFGQVEAESDANGATTSAGYDNQGRLTAVWLPGQDKAAGASATQVITYIHLNPLLVRRSQRNDDGQSLTTTDYVTTWHYIDGLGRVVQEQTLSPTGTGYIVADTRPGPFDQVVTQTAPYWHIYAPGTYRTPDWSKPSTRYAYDPLGRTTQITQSDNTVVRSFYNVTQTALIDANNRQMIQETDATVAPEAASNAPVIRNGRMVVSTLPGLGLDLDQDYLKANRAEGEPWWG